MRSQRRLYRNQGGVYAEVPSKPNLLAYYKLEEISGTSVIDSNGTNHANNTGQEINIYGKVNRGYTNKNGIWGAIVTPTMTGVKSVSAWFFSISPNASWTYFYDSRPDYTSYATNNAIFNMSRMHINGVSVATTKENLPKQAQGWTHLYLEFNSAFNGKFTIMTDRNISIGNRLVSDIDEIAIYNKALTIEEISQLYNNGIGSTY